MQVIKSMNPHLMLPEALHQLQTCGVSSESRNGKVLRFPTPVTLVHLNPRERVIFWPERDANPTFHLVEALWMLGGRRDVAFPASFVKSFADFSDDGLVFNGAYGYRWRRHFSDSSTKERYTIDQIMTIAHALCMNPDCRRQVLSMWDGHLDLGLDSKDLPCNTHAYVEIQDGRLNLTVCNRSNDLIWGALGSNVVHFSILAEVLATLTGSILGTYYQVSNNLHLYTERHEGLLGLASWAYPAEPRDPYREPLPGEEWLGVYPVASSVEEAVQLLEEVDLWCDQGGQTTMGMKSPFLRRIASPMVEAYRLYQSNSGRERYTAPIKLLKEQSLGTVDWFQAAIEWYERRLRKL